jgi:hypothetical protein
MPSGNFHVTPVNDNESDIEVDANTASDIEMENLPLVAGPSHNKANDDLSSLSESEDDDHSHDTEKIRKPAGEPGRPKSGGYTLEKEIASWGSDTIAKVNVSHVIIFESLHV